MRKLLLIPVLSAAAIMATAQLAGATNVDVGVKSQCVNGNRWEITATATNTHTAPLSVVFDNSIDPLHFDLAAKGQPGASGSANVFSDDTTFGYHWVPLGGAKLVGTLAGTLHRPAGCTQLTPPTTAAPTTVATTTPSVTVPASTVPAAVDSTTVTPTVPAGTPTSVSRPAAPKAQVSVPRAPLPPTCFTIANCGGGTSHDSATVWLARTGIILVLLVASMGAIFLVRNRNKL
jgi:hypothetical protein